jgi:hypothetical protein
MKKNFYATIVSLGVTALLFVSVTSTSKAQVDKARGTNWNNASALFRYIEDAIGTGNRQELINRLKELTDNLVYVVDQLQHTGDRLHEKDRQWRWQELRDIAVTKVKQTTVIAGVFSTEVSGADNSTIAKDYNDLKKAWDEAIASSNDLWKEYLAHKKQLDDIMKAFLEDCQECGK